jgi:hypothetical protein
MRRSPDSCDLRRLVDRHKTAFTRLDKLDSLILPFLPQAQPQVLATIFHFVLIDQARQPRRQREAQMRRLPPVLLMVVACVQWLASPLTL